MKRINSFFLILILVLSLVPINSFAQEVGKSPFAVSKADIKNLCGGGLTGNVKNSFVMSALSLCLAGVMEKTNENNQIKCEQIVCSYNAIKNGVDPSYCAKIASYKTCTLVVGEAFSLPGLNLFDYYRNIVKNIMANPVGIVFSASYYAARYYVQVTEPKDSLLVGASAIYVAATDIVSTIMSLKNMFENAFSDETVDKDYCSQIPDIKKEMEQIVKSYD